MEKEGLRESGFKVFQLDLPLTWGKMVDERDFEQLYSHCLSAMNDGQLLSNVLKPHFLDLTKDTKFDYELMLALREGPQTLDDEGIWHDDASRDMAFSLSLNSRPEDIIGGNLHIRSKEFPENNFNIPTQPWGNIIIFATGRYGWDHKVNRVTHGNRLVLVGWLSRHSGH